MSSGFILHRAEVDGMAFALCAMRNPHTTRFKDGVDANDAEMALASKLGSAPSGSGHDCMAKGITVAMDIYCDQSMHRQLLRYRFVDVVSSMSLEHSWKKVLFDDFLCQCVDPLILESLRAAYQVDVDREEPERKRFFLQNMPMGVMLGMSIRCNYLQLKTIWRQRHNHSHPGWREFCREMLEFPSFSLLTGCVRD